MTKQAVTNTIWISTFLVYFLPFLKWGNELEWDSSEISLLAVFPLFGLWAFAQMWLHYAVGAIKRREPSSFDYKSWYRITGNVVLVLFLLHPALLVFESQKAGIGPVEYVGEDNMKFLYLAYFALFSFLLYEVADRLQKSEFWKKNFGVVKVLSILAMLAIFIHSLNLGYHLQEGWLRYIWILMFGLFVAFVVDSYTYDPKEDNNKSN